MTSMPWIVRNTPWFALITALGAAMMGGLLFAFSNFVMRALSELSPASAMEAMQRINADIVNPTFLLLFLGTPVMAVLTAIASLKLGPAPGRWYVLAGTGCYLAGVLGVTMLSNIPMNNKLARLAAEAATEYWPQYLTMWLRWNHVRTISAISSAALLALGSYQQHSVLSA